MTQPGKGPREICYVSLSLPRILSEASSGRSKYWLARFYGFRRHIAMSQIKQALPSNP
jgi:hypothetical protein